MEHDGWRSFESLSTELFLVEGDKGFHIVKDLEWKLILKIRLSNYFQFLPFRWNSNQIWSPRLKCDTIFMSSSKYNYLFFLNGSILASFLFLYNKSEGSFWCQQDSNLHRQKRRYVRWPLVHHYHHSPKFISFVGNKKWLSSKAEDTDGGLMHNSALKLT